MERRGRRHCNEGSLGGDLFHGSTVLCTDGFGVCVYSMTWRCRQDLAGTELVIGDQEKDDLGSIRGVRILVHRVVFVGSLHVLRIGWS